MHHSTADLSANHATGDEREIIRLGIFLIVLQTADGWLTAIGISLHGLEMEGNGLIRAFMLDVGAAPAIITAKLFAIGAVVALVFLARRVAWLRDALGVMSCVYLFSAIIPWTYLLASS